MNKRESSPVKEIKNQSHDTTENRRRIAVLITIGLLDPCRQYGGQKIPTLIMSDMGKR